MPKINEMTEMNERLAQFMREEQLTAAKFAEIVQVQPSSISHLLSGRNNPNFEFIARLMRMFPDLNPDWLINGMGAMYRGVQADVGGLEPDVTSSPELSFEVDNAKSEALYNQQDVNLFTENTDVTPPFVDHQPEVPIAEAFSEGSTPASVVAGAGVQHVVVLFEDQTCVVYKNRK